MQWSVLVVQWQDSWFTISSNKKRIHFGQKNILLRYSRYENSGAPMLKIAIETDLVPSPKKYLNNAMRPSNRMILLKEETLEHEFYTNSLNIKKCEICLECHIEDKQSKEGETTYICQKCQSRKDTKYFLRNNLHPVWYEVVRYLILNAQLSWSSWAWPKNFLYNNVLIMSHRYTFLMEHVCLKGIASPSPKISQPCAMNCLFAKKQWLSSYNTLATKIHLQYIPSLCE